MTAQLANGGFEIQPRLIFDKKSNNLKNYLDYKNSNPDSSLPIDILASDFNLKPLFRNQENINFIKDAMFSSTNEPGGTSYGSRIDNKSSDLRAKLVLRRLKDLLKHKGKRR